jgi:uncharacterized protein
MERGVTPLAIAACAGNTRAVKWLLEHGAVVQVVEPGISAVSGAIDRGHTDVVELLLNGELDVNASVKGLILLSFASYAGRTEVARLLVARGANIDALDEDGRSALHHAAVSSNGAEMLAVLLELGAAPDAFKEPAKSPLVTAVRRGDVQCAQLLINAGADLTAPCMCDGKHAADLALCLSQTTDIFAKLALAHAIKAALNNDVQRPVLMVAATSAMVKMLLAAGADAHATDPNGNTTLHAAALAGYSAPVLCLLIKAGVNLHAANSDSKTAAQVAHDKGHTLAESLIYRAAQDS